MKGFVYFVTALVLATARSASAVPGSSVETRAERCGPEVGNCDPGECCSEAGHCGTTAEYCSGSQCQLEFSDSCNTLTGPPGPSTEKILRPLVGSVPYGVQILECRTPGLIALTYDDGPYEFTDELLEILDSHGVKATFFISGDNRGKGRIDDASTQWPATLRRMHNAGHHLASHTWTHRDLNQVQKSIQRSEMIYIEMAFRNIFGWFPTYMRPPYLECNEASGCLSEMETLGYHVIIANLDTKDYENDSPPLISKSEGLFSSTLSPNASTHSYITLAHDVHYQTVVNLTSYMITLSKQRGYKLVTVGECLNDPKENWYRVVLGRASKPAAPAISTVPATATKISQNTTSTNVAKPAVTANISTDQRCGGDRGSTCRGSEFGNCCSFFGFCGGGDEYCGTGCDPDYGDCNPFRGGIANTTNGLCGSFFHVSCSNYGDQNCCSGYGFCGNKEEHCGKGCQGKYGRCN